MKKLPLIISFLLSLSVFAQTTTVKKTTTTTHKTYSSKNKKSTTTKMPAGVQVWTVDAQRAKCEAATTQMCLLVKQPGHKAFELFYDNIAGFDYVEGFVYTIWVRQEEKTPPIPAGASIYNYSLVKVVSKKSIPSFTNSTVDNSKPQSGMSEVRKKTLIVNEEKAPCGDKKCLLVQEEGKKTFELFYGNIQGFTFEPGFRQTIIVTETNYPNPATGVTEPVYNLIAVVSKVPVGTQTKDTSSTPAGWAKGRTVLDKKWYLKKMKDSDTTSYTIVDNAVWIEFVSSENKYSGIGPCNNFFGGFKSDLISSFQASAITSSKVYCANMRLEEMLFSLFQNADTFRIEGGQLKLFKGDRLLLMFEEK